MIAEVPAKRGDGGSSFRSLAKYITGDRDQLNPLTGEVLDRGVSIHTNCLSPKTAWAEMWGAAGQSKRVKDPVYHVVLSWRDSEQPTDQQCFEAAQEAMKAVVMEGHQFVAAVHRDTGNVHVHLLVNRVHPETYKAIYPHRDFFSLDKCMREVELTQGWSHDNGPYAVHDRGGIKVVDWARASANDWRLERAELGKVRLPDKARKMEAMTGNESFASYVQSIFLRPVLDELSKPDADWQALHVRLFTTGLMIKPKGQGLAIYSATDPKQTPVKASLMHESLGAGKLVKKLGPYQAMTESLERIVADFKPPIRYSPQLPKRDADARLERRDGRANDREQLKTRYQGYRDSWNEAKAPAKTLMMGRHLAVKEATKERHKNERVHIARGEESDWRGFDGEKVVSYQLDEAKVLDNNLDKFASPSKGMSKEDQAIARSVLSMLHADEKQALQDRFKAERAAMRAEKPREYREWVADRAQEGDRVAISQLRGWAYQEKRAEATMKREDAVAAKTPHVTTELEGTFEPAEPKQVIDREEGRSNKVTFQVNRDTGSVSYQINDRQAFTDHGKRIVFDNTDTHLDPAVIEAGLRLASEKFRNAQGEPGKIKVYGEGEFQQKLAEASLAVAVDRELDVVFADPELERRRVAMLAELLQERVVGRDAADESGHRVTPDPAGATAHQVAFEPAYVRPMTWAERQRALQEPEPQLDRHTILVRAEYDEVLKLDRAKEKQFMAERGARPLEKQGFLAGPASRREAEKWDKDFQVMKAQTYQETTILKEHLRSEEPATQAWRERELAPHETAHQGRVDEWRSKHDQATREGKLADQGDRNRRRELVLGAGKEKSKDKGQQLEPGGKQLDADDTRKEKQPNVAKEESALLQDVDAVEMPSDEREARKQRVLQAARIKEAPAPAPTIEQTKDDDYGPSL